MPFRVPRAVLALAIRLVHRLRIDPRTGRSRALVVRIDILHVDEKARVRDICR